MMYNEKYHPVAPETLKYAIENKSYSEEEREFITTEVKKANDAKVRNFKVILPSGEYVEFQNGVLIGSKAE